MMGVVVRKRSGWFQLLGIFVFISSCVMQSESNHENDMYDGNSGGVSGITSSSIDYYNNLPFQSIPLVPHHVQKRRRKLPTSGASGSDNESRRRRRASHSEIREVSVSEEGETVNTALQLGALYQGYGTHYADLWCGTPPQRQTVIVDTGSSVTAFPCDGCKDCGETKYHIDNLFLQDQSSSFHQLECNECKKGRCSLPKGSKYDNCKIGMSYQEGSSWTAFEATDLCYVAGPHNGPLTVPVQRVHSDEGIKLDDLDPNTAASLAFPLTFGCQTKLTGLFKTQLADGIMGMDNANEAFWKQMHTAGKMESAIFTLCFSRADHVDRKGTAAGAMTLGGIDPRLHTTTMIFTEDNSQAGFYAVKIRKLYIRTKDGGDSIIPQRSDFQIKQVEVSESDLDTGRTIVDSGTTDTYFSRNVAGAFKVLWKEMFGQEYSQRAVALTAEQLDKYPTIIIQMKGNKDLNPIVANNDPSSVPGLAGPLDPDHPYDVLLAVPPRHYMEYDEDQKKYVNRFYLDEARGTVIGANAMMGHDIVFDIDHNRLGWAESDCNYTDIVTKYGYEPDTDASYVSPTTADEEVEEADTSKAKSEEAEQKVEKGSDKGRDGEPKDEQEIENTTESAFFSSNIPGSQYCSSFICQGGILAVIMIAALGITFRYKRTRKRSRPTFNNVSQSELELQEGYRDTPMDDDDDDDDDDDEIDDDDEMPARRSVA